MIVNLPKDMDIPAQRRDVTEPENVQWLLRNLGARNGDHPNFKTVLLILKKLAKSKH